MNGTLELGFVLASATAEVSEHYPSLGESLWALFLITLLLLANAFFVASEFAIVKVRPSQVEAAGKLKGKPFPTAEKVVGNLDGYLSANQLGITLASLALGFIAEPFVASLIGPSLKMLPWFPENLISGTSFFIALISFTFLHVVVGELLPKSVAIRKPLESTLLLAPPLNFFYFCSWPAIYFLQGTSNRLLKWIFRLDPADESEVHSSEELALLVHESGESEEVTKTEKQILINALELNDMLVREVMLPRSEAVALDLEKTFEDNLALAIRTKHTRFPLVRGHFDNTVGLIHIKDILKLVGDEAPDLLKIKRELKVVPETMPLDGLLEFFLKERAHLAMVVDEYGDPAGLVFMDNIMEELVGDIQDEFDNEEAGYTQVNEEEFVVEGSFSVNELETIFAGFELDAGEVTTIGGYITQQLGRLPEPGEILRIDDFEAKVTSTDGRRVGQVHLRRLSDKDLAEEVGSLA
ncbi:hemolysin family protein [Roseibacillus ishigakijimensis]|uniref:HlyC/CorC family transporter n=1 Tax=Roseibacillus ishigakijimensis TaxID=454146 RepID=A0A934VLL4_9BACT|nr:hemolysin family protein [Roseibacillus ishigakijimensis]MBK1833015.1 HlyC/CorC family transporter [Roseibacillus ishigakijimensis]